jgi:hypothetical protein
MITLIALIANLSAATMAAILWLIVRLYWT